MNSYPNPFGELIAERVFASEMGDVYLQISKPVLSRQGWTCAVRIKWPDKGVKLMSVDGLDAIEAILLAVKKAEAFLSGVVKHDNLLLRWNGEANLSLTIDFDPD